MEFSKAGLEYIEQLVQLRLDFLTEDHGTLSDEEIKRISEKLPEYYKKHLNNDLSVYICTDENEIVSCCFLLVSEKPANPGFSQRQHGNGA